MVTADVYCTSVAVTTIVLRQSFNFFRMQFTSLVCQVGCVRIEAGKMLAWHHSCSNIHYKGLVEVVLSQGGVYTQPEDRVALAGRFQQLHYPLL